MRKVELAEFVEFVQGKSICHTEFIGSYPSDNGLDGYAHLLGELTDGTKIAIKSTYDTGYYAGDTEATAPEFYIDVNAKEKESGVEKGNS